MPWQESGFYVDTDTITPAVDEWTTFTTLDEPEWDPSGDYGVSIEPPDSDLTDPNGTYTVRFPNKGIKGGGGGGGIELTRAAPTSSWCTSPGGPSWCQWPSMAMSASPSPS